MKRTSINEKRERKVLTRMDRAVDYIVGRVLPYMHETPASVEAMVCDFTVDEAKQLKLDGLPVMMNHNDGTTDTQSGTTRHLDCIGHVEAMSMRGVDARVLLAIEPDGSHANTYSSNAVANGIYSGLSLGNRVDGKSSADTGRNTLVKTPTEVSLCKEGKRYGSTIEHFMPCRATCERLYDAGPETLTGMVKRHKYTVSRNGEPIPVKDRKQYIDVLMQLSDERITQLRESEQLFPSHITVRASMSTDSSTVVTPATVIPTEQQVQPMDTDTPAVEAKEPEIEASRASVTEIYDEPDVRNAKAMAAEALKSKEEVIRLRVQLVEAEKAKTELSAIRERESAKKREEFETIVRSFIENASKAQMEEKDIQHTVVCAQDLFKENPDSAMHSIENSLTLSVRASQQSSKLESLRAQQLLAQTNSQNDAFFNQTASRLTALRDQERSFSLTAMAAGTRVPITSLSNSQLTELAAPVAPPASTFDKRFVPQQAPVTQTSVPAAPVMKETKPAPLFVRASETDAGSNDYDARDQFLQQLKLTGRIPSMTDVSFGVSVEHTGQMKASASGEQVPVTRMVRLRNSPAAVEPANFSPEWDAMLTRALGESQKRPERWLTTDQIRLLKPGSGFNV